MTAQEGRAPKPGVKLDEQLHRQKESKTWKPEPGGKTSKPSQEVKQREEQSSEARQCPKSSRDCPGEKGKAEGQPHSLQSHERHRRALQAVLRCAGRFRLEPWLGLAEVLLLWLDITYQVVGTASCKARTWRAG